jgi:hypothetical protein
MNDFELLADNETESTAVVEDLTEEQLALIGGGQGMTVL